MDTLSMGNMAHASVHTSLRVVVVAEPLPLVILCMTTEKIPQRGARGHQRMDRPRSGLALTREYRLLETITANKTPFRMVGMVHR
jgi:hypothetical protein